MNSPEAAIVAAFPGDDAPHRTARLALLRLLHAGENVSTALDSVEDWIEYILQDPVEAIYNGVLAERAAQQAQQLDAFAREFRKSAKALASIKSQWQRFDDSQEVRNEIRGTPGRDQQQQNASDPETPF